MEMGILRAVVRLAAIATVTSVLYALLMAGLLSIVSDERRRSFRYRLFRTWARSLVRICGIELLVDGTPPRAPFFLVTNHLSYVDILVLSSLVDCVYVARGDLKRWPLVGRLSRSVEIIFVDRDRRSDVNRVNRCIERSLESGESVVLFAEGPKYFA